MTLKDAIALLDGAGVPSPEYDAREIFGHFSGAKRPFGLLPEDTVASPEVERAIKRRKRREPLQYIIGEVGFYREVYRVSPDCLIPRSDTEMLVDYAVRHIPAGESFIDLCTGSGCIAVSTVKNTRDTRAVAVDISARALALAKENAELNGVNDRIEFIGANLLSEDIELGGGYYAVLSNPPYVTSEAYGELEDELYFEPKIALVAEDDGLEFYKRIVPLGLSLVRADGFIALEIGYDQADALRRIAKEHQCDIEIIKDYSALDRVAVLRKRK